MFAQNAQKICLLRIYAEYVYSERTQDTFSLNAHRTYLLRMQAGHAYSERTHGMFTPNANKTCLDTMLTMNSHWKCLLRTLTKLRKKNRPGRCGTMHGAYIERCGCEEPTLGGKWHSAFLFPPWKMHECVERRAIGESAPPDHPMQY